MNPVEINECVALILDLGLVPRNYWASDLYQILENEEMRRNRIECDLRLLSKRNHSRKYVSASDCDYLQGTLEL